MAETARLAEAAAMRAAHLAKKAEFSLNQNNEKGLPHCDSSCFLKYEFMVNYLTCEINISRIVA